MRIAAKISLSFFLTALVITGGIVPVTYFIAKHDLEAAIYRQLRVAAQARITHIDIVLKEYIKKVELFAQDDLARAALRGTRTAKEEFFRKVMAMSAGDEEIAHIRLLDSDGRILVSNYDDEGVDMGEDALFLKGREGVFIRDIYVSEFARDVFMSIAAPVMVDGEPGGVIVVDFDAKGSLFELLMDRTGLGRTGEIYIITGDEEMIVPAAYVRHEAAINEGNRLTTRQYLQKIRQQSIDKGGANSFSYVSYRGNPVLGVHHKIPFVGWELLTEIDEAEAFAPLMRLRFILLMILITVPLAALFVGRIISGMISGSLRRLKAGFEMIAQGKLEYRLGSTARDEIGDLSRAFDTMAEDLKNTTTSVHIYEREAAERRSVEQALRESERSYKILAEVSPVGIYHTDAHGYYYYVNERWSQISGVPVREAEGVGWKRTIHEEDRPRVVKAWREFVEDGTPFKCEYRHQHPDGEVNWVFAQAVAERDPQGVIVGFVGTITDVTERKRAEQELKETEQQLFQAEKLASVGQMAAGIAHEIKNPLTSILGFAQLILEDAGIDERIREHERVVETEARRCVSIIDNFLNFARPQQPRKMSVSINEVIDLTLKVLDYRFEQEKIHLIKRYDQELPSVFADPNQIQQVFMNIVFNALNAMGQAGTLTIVTGVVEKQETPGQRYVRAAFKDTGSGIADELKEKIFDPFFTTSYVRGRKGMGLGLSISHTIIKAHGGWIELDTEVGKGSVFSVLLPVFTQSQKV